MINAMVPQKRQYLFHHKNKDNKTTRAQEDVVNSKECGELVSLSLPQEGLNEKNDGEV